MLSNLKGIESYKKYLETLALSTALAGLMLFITFGLMSFPQGEKTIPKHFILLLLAVFFVIFTVFYESKERDKERMKKKRKWEEGYQSLLKGLFLAVCATFAFVTTLAGIKYIQRGGIHAVGGMEVFISALAVCIIVSMTLLSMLKPLETR
jgi:drug/metabolite transporter (DMT)-like permease